MEAGFQAICEAAAVAWDISALAVGTSIGGVAETAGIGCEPETRLRVASVTKPFTATLALGLLDLEAPSGVWPADVRVRHLLSHTSGFDGECGDLARFGDGDGALAAVVAELPSVRRWLGVEQAWSYANAGDWLVGGRGAQGGGGTDEEGRAGRVPPPARRAAAPLRAPPV